MPDKSGASYNKPDVVLNTSLSDTKTQEALENIVITKTLLKKKSLVIKWTKADGADGYQVLRAAKTNGKYRLLGETDANTHKFPDKDFRGKRKKYFYKVKAVSKSNDIICQSEPVGKTVYKRKSRKNGATYIDGILIANKTYSLAKTYNPGTDQKAYKAFLKMKSAAAKDGINLFIVSGFRSYDYQKTLYKNYVLRDGKTKADTYSARPGHSEHQTGLAFDINSADLSFENTKEAKWLKKNCSKFGFIIRYPKNKESITGYKYEPWHIRFLGKKLAKKVSKTKLCLEEYLNIKSEYC